MCVPLTPPPPPDEEEEEEEEEEDEEEEDEDEEPGIHFKPVEVMVEYGVKTDPPWVTGKAVVRTPCDYHLSRGRYCQHGCQWNRCCIGYILRRSI